MIRIGKKRDAVEEKEESVRSVGYRDGAEGMIAWCEDKVCLPIYPVGEVMAVWWSLGDLPDDKHPTTGKSYKDLWEFHKEVLREALVMEHGVFKYRQIVFCWMRGEGKSILAVLIQLWKFFNWTRQMIVLGANSKDQIKFVHYDWMKDIILNSPRLLKDIGGPRNIKEKDIQLKDKKGRVQSTIRSISTASGIVSNITGYTFSEIFAMKKPDFYTQLDGSIRNVPNALGVIDSTISAKNHILYQLYTGFIQGKTKSVYFSYRSSPKATSDDFMHPHMTQDQLEDYKIKFPFGEFDRYFRNTWGAGANKVFTPTMIEEMTIASAEGLLFDHDRIKELLNRKEALVDLREHTEEAVSEALVHSGKMERTFAGTAKKISEILDCLKTMDTLYKLVDHYGHTIPASLSDLQYIGDLIDTDWTVIAGVDFGDPYAQVSSARSVLTVFAKGLPGSRSNPTIYLTSPTAPKYMYFLLYIVVSENNNNDVIKEGIELAHSEFMGVDILCSEHYGAWDMKTWCEERDIEFEVVHPSYDKQKEAFKALLLAVREGRMKWPAIIGIAGSKKNNILEEEFAEFDHDASIKWFGSTEKKERYGIQDDCVYATGWAIYGGRMKGVDDFRIRKMNRKMFGEFGKPKGLIGSYT